MGQLLLEMYNYQLSEASEGRRTHLLRPKLQLQPISREDLTSQLLATGDDLLGSA